MLSVVPATNATATNDAPTFEDFWLLWPKRVARMNAEKAWNRLNGADRVGAVTALVQWRTYWLARGELEYVPHAATWLNQQRWSDELPESWGVGHASHNAAAIPDQGAKAAMPEHVRAMIAKLRGGR